MRRLCFEFVRLVSRLLLLHDWKVLRWRKEHKWQLYRSSLEIFSIGSATKFNMNPSTRERIPLPRGPWLQSLCFDPCFIFRCWRASQSACKQISAFTSTRTCSTAARPFEEPLKAACGPWPCGSRPPTHPPETLSSTAETCWPCSTLSPVAPLRSSKTTSWWPSWVSPLGLPTRVQAGKWSKSWS